MTHRTIRRLLVPAAALTAAAAVSAPALAGPQEGLPNLTTSISGPASLTANQPGTWVATVANTGTVPVAANTIVLHVGDLGRYDVTPDVPDADDVLNPGEQLTYTINERLHGNICGKKQPLTVTATAHLSEGDEATEDDNAATATTTVTDCATDLALTKTADRDTYAPGDTITWTVTVTNTGNTSVAVEDARVSDPLLPTLTLQSAPADGYLDPGESAVYSGTQVATAAQCGAVTNRASVSIAAEAELIDLSSGNDAASRSVAVAGGACAPPPSVEPPAESLVEPPLVQSSQAPRVASCPAPRLSLALRSQGSVVAGRRFPAVIQVRNVSRRNRAQSVELRYTLPRGTSLVTIPNGARLSGGRLVMRVGSLAAGRAASLTVNLRVSRTLTGALTHSARATAKCTGGTAAVRQAQVTAAPRRVLPAVTG